MEIVYMDVEDTIFPPNPGAVQVENEEDIDLEIIQLNIDIHIKKCKHFETLLERLNYIHCKAFGEGTGITLTKDESGKRCKLNYLTQENTEYMLVFLSKGEDTNYQDIVIMAVLSLEKAGGALQNNRIGIWSVAKNPDLQFQNAFRILLQKIKEDEELLQYGTFYLQVSTTNNTRMTEQGRIRLYASLGFNIEKGLPVETIYPPGRYLFDTHEAGNVGKVELLFGDKVSKKCDFIGNLRAPEGSYLYMTSSREDLAKERDIYCTFKESFKGKTFLVNTGHGVDQIQIDAPIIHNRNVDITPALEFVNSPSAAVGAGAPAVQTNFFKTLYHMNLRKVIVENNNNYIDYCDVPEDFLVITLTSPGSNLIAYDGKEIDGYIRNILPYLQNKETFQHLLHTHRSTATLPIYNIEEHEFLVTNAAKALSNNDPSLCDRQLVRSILNSIIIDRLGRQPIFEIPIPKTSSFPIKKIQLDIQIYTPGMRMFDFVINRDDKDPIDKEANLGTYKIHQDGTTNTIGEQDKTDNIFVNNNTKTFTDYFNYIRNIGGQNGGKNILIAFGCAPVFTSGAPKSDYELLYELSHRRSIIHRFPEGTRLDSLEFLNTAFLGKDKLTEYKCSDDELYGMNVVTTSSSSGAVGAGAGQGGGKRKRKFGKTKRSSSRTMATRFRRLRTRKMRKTKGLKTRKMKKGGASFF